MRRCLTTGSYAYGNLFINKPHRLLHIHRLSLLLLFFGYNILNCIQFYKFLRVNN